MRFLYQFILVVAVFSGVFFGFISVVDPYGESGGRHFPLLVLDSRRAKIQLLPRFRRQGEVAGLILGSSRSLLLRPGAINGSEKARVFNFAVDNGHAEDFLTIYRYAVLHDVVPRFLVIGLDVASLQSDDVHDHMFDRSDLRHYLEPGTAKTWQLPVQGLLDVKAAFTKDHLKDALKSIFMKVKHQTPKTKFGADGYEVQYSGEPLPPGELRSDADFSDSVKNYKLRIAGMRNLSPKRLGYMEQLFTEARQHDTKIVVWLTPVHPRLQELIVAASNYADLIEQVNQEAAKWVSKYGIRYKDFTDVNAFGGVATGWNDSSHMDTRNMEMVGRALSGEVHSGL